MLLYQFVIPHGGIYVEDPVFTTTTTMTSSTSTSTSVMITTDPGVTTTQAMTSITEPITTTTEPPVTTTTTTGLSYPGDLPDVLASGTVIGTYFSDTVLMTVYQIRASNSDVFVVDVVVESAYEILTALAFNTFGGVNITQKVSEMATAHNAIFAINSDYASHYSSGFVIRNGSILRATVSNRNAIALMADGTVTTFAETDRTVQSVFDDGAWQLWSFGPVLVKDGISVADVHDGLDRDAVNNPRSAFGAVGTNHFMFVCVDGRTDASHGADIEELATIMLSLNCVQAYNFDGGGSATMWFDGEVINHPSEGSERKVGDCVYIRQ
ncbi:MAG: phosphodiester glycosidase family protein [bacterium]